MLARVMERFAQRRHFRPYRQSRCILARSNLPWNDRFFCLRHHPIECSDRLLKPAQDGCEVQLDAVPPRAGLHIHTFGARGDLLDEGGYFRATYATTLEDCVLVRPDGHVGAIVGSGDGDIEALERYRTAGAGGAAESTWYRRE